MKSNHWMQLEEMEQKEQKSLFETYVWKHLGIIEA
jgi:hypothetical protein